MKYALFSTFIVWASSLGYIEAILYSKKGAEAFKINEHIVYTISRISVMIMVLLSHLYSGQFNIWYACLSCLLSFSFWHNGTYYETRKLIDVSYYRFTSNSKTSSAWIELNYKTRLSLKLIGLIILITLT